MLPAGLWSGLVLTVLVLFVLVCWMKKRKSDQTGEPHMCGFCIAVSSTSSSRGLQKRYPRSQQCAHIKATTTRHKLLHSRLIPSPSPTVSFTVNAASTLSHASSLFLESRAQNKIWPLTPAIINLLLPTSIFFNSDFCWAQKQSDSETPACRAARRCDALSVWPLPVCTGGPTRLAGFWRDAHRRLTHYQKQLPHSRSPVSVSLPAHRHSPQHATVECTDGSACDISAVNFLGHVLILLHTHWFTGQSLAVATQVPQKVGHEMWSVVSSAKHGPWFNFFPLWVNWWTVRSSKTRRTGSCLCCSNIMVNGCAVDVIIFVLNSETNYLDNPEWW